MKEEKQDNEENLASLDGASDFEESNSEISEGEASDSSLSDVESSPSRTRIPSKGRACDPGENRVEIFFALP